MWNKYFQTLSLSFSWISLITIRIHLNNIAFKTVDYYLNGLSLTQFKVFGPKQNTTDILLPKQAIKHEIQLGKLNNPPFDYKKHSLE